MSRAMPAPPPRRFRRLETAEILGVRAHLAVGFRSRLLGLAHLSRARAPAGLLIPRCSAVHTLGMRFPIDVVFLDAEGGVARRVEALPPRRLVRHRGAAAVLEVPAAGASTGGRRFGRRA